MITRRHCFSPASVRVLAIALLSTRSVAAPEVLPAEWGKYRDVASGHEVWRITRGNSPNQAAHFNAQGFTADERYMVFASRRTGTWQLFRVDLEAGALARLTDVPDLDETSFTVHPVLNVTCFSFAGKLGYADILTAKLKVFEYDFPVTFRRMFSSDGRFAVVTTPEENGVRVMRVSFPDGAISGGFSWKGALVWEGGLSHPLINPGNPDLISFVPSPDTQNDMTRPREHRARTWIGNVVTGEMHQFLTMPNGFRATHEVWGNSGERFYFFQKTHPGWLPVQISSIRVDGSDWRAHYTHDTIRLGHGAVSDDERWFVADGQDLYQNPIVLISLETGNAEILAWANTSIAGGHPKQAHAHPSFSASGRYIAYTSNRTGTPQAYVIPVPASVQDRLRVQPASR